MEIHKKILRKMVLRGNKNKVPREREGERETRKEREKERREWGIKTLLTTSNAIN